MKITRSRHVYLKIMYYFVICIGIMFLIFDSIPVQATTGTQQDMKESAVKTTQKENTITDTEAVYKKASVNVQEDYYIFVGDSRTVGMKKALTDKQKENCFFVAKNGKGLTWLKEEGIQQLREIINYNPDVIFNIVLLLGVNDLGNKKKYVDYYNTTIEIECTKHNLYVVSVNPVIEEVLLEHGYKERPVKKIIQFNQYMKDNIDIDFSYIDVYDQLVNKEGYGMIDGLHYMPYTYSRIYEIILSEIKDIQDGQ